MSKCGILLINLGTPDHCDPKSVRRYLKEFLNDPRVIDIPPLLRWLLVNVFIIPLRYKKSAAAYQLIWQEKGSPLLVHSQQLKNALAQTLGDQYQVELAMRYGQPRIEDAVERLAGCERVIVIPLFPQYASASTGSAIEKTLKLFSKQWNIPEIVVKKDFYNQSKFISSYAEVIQQHTKDHPIDLLLFSYHGLPERHIDKSQCKAPCARNIDCPRSHQDASFCYRAQCYETSLLIAKELGLASEQYCTSFQSRLGRTPWIKPYTDLLLPELRRKGVKNIAIACPSFVADCLETLEEINIRAREQWQQCGGENFIFIPCLNSHPMWVEALAEQVR
jgi:ferrochelatase